MVSSAPRVRTITARPLRRASDSMAVVRRAKMRPTVVCRIVDSWRLAYVTSSRSACSVDCRLCEAASRSSPNTASALVTVSMRLSAAAGAPQGRGGPMSLRASTSDARSSRSDSATSRERSAREARPSRTRSIASKRSSRRSTSSAATRIVVVLSSIMLERGGGSDSKGPMEGMLGREECGICEGLPRCRSIASAASGSSSSAPSTTRHRATSCVASAAPPVESTLFSRSSSPWQNQDIGSSPTALAAPFIVWTWR